MPRSELKNTWQENAYEKDREEEKEKEKEKRKTIRRERKDWTGE